MWQMRQQAKLGPALLLALCIAVGAAANPFYATNRVIVTTDPTVVHAMAAEEQGLEFAKAVGQQGAILYNIKDGTDAVEKAAQLNALPGVVNAEPDWKVYVAGAAPNDPGYPLQWHHTKINSLPAWDISTGSAEVKVCHVDSGVRVDHPDLAQNVLKGWNLIPPSQVEGDAPPRAGSPEYFNYNDTYGHGTHTAGIIAAVGNNEKGIAGVNWNLKLLVCRFIWNDGSGYISDAMACIKLCRQEGAMITSNSWGGVGYSEFLEREIAASQAAGQLFVVASGNSGVNLEDTKLYPASYKTDNMISVASTGKTDYVSAFSNIGLSTVHMVAPGEAIYSTFMDGGYKLMWGTSMACPLVAGTAALMQSYALSRGTTLTYSEMKNLILTTVDRVDDAADKTITGGRLNVGAAMLALKAILDQRGAVLPTGQGGPPAQPVGVPPPPPPPSPTPPSPSPVPAPPPTPAPTGGSTAGTQSATGLVCGGSPLKGLGTASQSSTVGYSIANYAIDGECRKRRVWQGSCSQTKNEPNPWWMVRLAFRQPVVSVSVQTTSECACVADLVGARIMIGNGMWRGPGSASSYTECARISGIVRGQRKTFTCATRNNRPPQGRYIVIWRPTNGTARRQLTLCEVDAVLGTDVQAVAKGLSTQSPAPAALRQAGRRLRVAAAGSGQQQDEGEWQQLQQPEGQQELHLPVHTRHA